MAVVALTDAFVRSIKPGATRAEYWDAKVSGLCLRMTPTGVATWTFRYRPQGSTSFKRLNLGRYPEVSLAKARERAETQRVAVSGGADPQGEIRSRREQSARALTFGKLAAEYLQRYARIQKKSWQQDELLLRVHVLPEWNGRGVDKLTRADAAALLDKIAVRAPSSANRTHTVMSKVFNWAVDSGLLENSPMTRMKKRARETPKERVLSPGEIRVLWRALERSNIAPAVAAAMRFLLLTGQRPGEVTEIALAEIKDVDNGARARIELPAARMKGGRAHVVPLAPMALEIVRAQMRDMVEGQAHLFPSTFASRGPIARHSVSQAVRRIVPTLTPDGPDREAVLSLKANPPTPHDFRRTVATGLAALGVLREDRMALLAHSYGDIHSMHYDKHDRFKEKRAALELWEAHIAEILEPATGGNVVKLRGRK
ncbi:site-specific integrase [Methylocystis sp. ATCC 49242]|uniref:tyrosine-type recombinase/integrase n=1 Tax=Methylocystis sp. ATCC 49242 TaxID=622637 RepID=UPI0001F873D0|nr:site-specific integrase [Methylocystis sp. ATCC 49242]